ncbi:hypothetical protein CLOP_g25394 [Closterium sp. NIES-67]|nr:hypothetical protein CLOP_g25394 [Closterium sp. NIES-67]
MRVKRQREVRRHVRFYRTCCGFREPFKVVCDGTFLHHVTRLKLSPPAASLPKLLGFPTRVHITRCILAELQRLGTALRTRALQPDSWRLQSAIMKPTNQ